MNTKTVQLALFTKEYINRPDLLGISLNDKMNNIFDTMPNIINLPQGAPHEMPVVHMQSENMYYGLNISRNRLDFFISPSVENQPLDVFENRYSELISKYVKAVYSELEISRIGIIATVVESIEKACSNIANRYFNADFDETTELSFRRNKVTKQKGISINSILDVSNNVSIDKENIRKENIVYIRDVNSSIKHDTITLKLCESIVKYMYGMMNDEMFRGNKR